MIGALVAGITGSGGASLSSYESIATATVSGSSNTITFSSIPSGFKHLQLRIMTRGTANGGTTPLLLFCQANSDTGSNYYDHRLLGDGTSVTQGGTASAQTRITMRGYADSGYAANIFGVFIIDIYDYTSTTKNKTFSIFSGVDDNSGTTSSVIWEQSGFWISSTAITSLTFTNNGADNFSSSSSFALYGIKEA